MDFTNEAKQLTVKYNKCKSIVVKWESAFIKEKRRQPRKDDFYNAPAETRLAYTKYMEIKRILAQIEAKRENFQFLSPTSSTVKRNQKSIRSPCRIFIKGDPNTRKSPAELHERNSQKSVSPPVKSNSGFRKLSSRLYDTPDSEINAPATNLKDVENDFDIGNILIDVQKALESFGKDDEEILLIDAPKFEFDLGKSDCPNTEYAPLTLDDRLSKHSFFAGSQRPREVDQGWLDRCVAEIQENSEPTTEQQTIEKIPEKVNIASGKRKTEAKINIVSEKRKAPVISAAEQYEFLEDSAGVANDCEQKRGKKRVRLTTKEVTEKKISTGKGNDNFVRIDVTKKRFVRGKRKMTGFQHKRRDLKMKKRQDTAEKKNQLVKCRRCGGIGHFAKFCFKADLKDQSNNPEEFEVDDSPFPTLEEAARMYQSQQTPQTLKSNSFNDENTSQIPNDSMDIEIENHSSGIGNDDEEEPRLVLVSHDDDSLSDPKFSQSSNCSQLDLSISSDSNSMMFSEEIANSNSTKARSVQPIFPSEMDSPILTAEDETMLTNALNLFGFEEFRPGQKEAITRVLRGDSTLVVLSTGSGKSLCYLLPAYLYAQKYPDAIIICVSPLVSLMEDQIQSIPSFITGSCLHTNMTEKQREVVLEKIRKKKLNILLVSPEAICGGLFGLLRNVADFPPVAFACVDEVHCVSEWSHNFRPSYLRVCKILRARLNVQTILGLTATATTHTLKSVCSHLCIDPSSVIRGEIVPLNLRLSCSRDLDREVALITLLKSKRFEECDSIIIYCTQREQCEKIAILIRTVLRDKPNGLVNENSKRKISAECEAYHAGMSAARRKAVQNNFMSGQIRIVVATIAFGMGIDKSNIRAVIHYNMPKTFESFVQEIGRAGRDGLPAECHAFLDSKKGKDICELRRHIYSNSVDRTTLRKFLTKVFQPCLCQTKGRTNDNWNEGEKNVCPGHEISFSVEKTVNELDLPDENIETLLCYLESYQHKSIQLLPKCYHKCSIQSYGGTKLLKMAAKRCPPLAAAIALQKDQKKFKDDDMHVEFNFIEVATTLGWNSGQVRKELKSLEWTGTQFDEAGNPIKFRKSGILVEFTDLAYRIIAPGDLSDEESDRMLNFLHDRNLNQERLELFQLEKVYQCLFRNSYKEVESVCDLFNEEKSIDIKQQILDYFNEAEVGVPVDWKLPLTGAETEKEEVIRQDIRHLLNSHGDNNFTSRSIAKIFLGISSPCFPAMEWYRNKSFWRRHLDVDFHFLCKLAAEELI